MIQATGGEIIAKQMMHLPLTPVAIAYTIAVLMRFLSLGSATAAIITASGLLHGLAQQLPGQETLLVLAVAVGTIVFSQPADRGFWMKKEYGNLTVRETLIRLNAGNVLMSLTGLGILLIVEAW